jgi:hypothetical protein
VVHLIAERAVGTMKLTVSAIRNCMNEKYFFYIFKMQIFYILLQRTDTFTSSIEIYSNFNKSHRTLTEIGGSTFIRR